MTELEESLPKYRQIAGYFRDRILRGDLRPGDEVPSERALAAQFTVSRPTATKALEVLRVEGLVVSSQGSGTYVADPQVNLRARERYRRSRAEGRIYPPDEYAIITFAGLIPSAPTHVAEALALPVGTAAVRRHRITNNAEGPCEVSTSWFPGELAERAPRLVQTERIAEGTLAYVESVARMVAAYARDRVSARYATDVEADELRLADGARAPVLCVDHIVCDGNDLVIEYVEAVYPPGRRTYEQRYGI